MIDTGLDADLKQRLREVLARRPVTEAELRKVLDEGGACAQLVRGRLERGEQRLSELVPELPLYNVTRLDAVPTTLKNFKGNPTNTGIFWNIHEWEIR